MAIAEIECRKLQNPKKMTSKKKQQEAAPKHERTRSDMKNRSCHQLFFFGFDVIFWMVYGWFHIIVDVFIQAYM